MLQVVIFELRSSFNFNAFASPAGGLRNRNAAAFASFEKYPPRRINSNSGFAGTEPKPVCRMQSGREAAYPVTGEN